MFGPFTNEPENWFENCGVDKGNKNTCRALWWPWARYPTIQGIRPYHNNSIIPCSGQRGRFPALFAVQAPPKLSPSGAQKPLDRK